jgi:hypothetical protein
VSGGGEGRSGSAEAGGGQAGEHEPSKAESLKLIGGLIALGAGLLALGLITGGALWSGTDNAVKIATGAFGVIGTLVGAYFGQKVGSDGTKEAVARAGEEATKAQVYAAHLPPGEAAAIVELAHKAAAGGL